MTDVTDEVNEILKGVGENKTSKLGGEENKVGPAAEADRLLLKFETDLKKFDRAKKEINESVLRIIPVLEEEKRILKTEIEVKSKRVEEINEEINTIEKWKKKHKDLLKSAE